MDDKNKVQPQRISGTVTLGSITSKVGVNAVENNESVKPSEEFIETLEQGVKENVFPAPKQNGQE